MRMTTWRVRLYWTDSRGTFEAGADAALPASTTAIEAIRTVAEWRSVNLDICSNVEAERGSPSDEWESA